MKAFAGASFRQVLSLRAETWSTPEFAAWLRGRPSPAAVLASHRLPRCDLTVPSSACLPSRRATDRRCFGQSGVAGNLSHQPTPCVPQAVQHVRPTCWRSAPRGGSDAVSPINTAALSGDRLRMPAIGDELLRSVADLQDFGDRPVATLGCGTRPVSTVQRARRRGQRHQRLRAGFMPGFVAIATDPLVKPQRAIDPKADVRLFGHAR